MKFLRDFKNKVVEEYQTNWKFKLNKSKQILFALALAGTTLPSDAPLGRLQYHVESIQEYVEQYGDDILYEKLCVCEPIIKHVHHEKIVHVPIDSEGQAEQKQTLEDVVNEKYELITYTEFERRNHQNAIERIDKYDKIFQQYANRYGVEKNLMKAIAFVESQGNHTGLVTKKWKNKIYTKKIPGHITTSYVGAKGMMQLMPDTAKELGVNPKYLRSNIMGATKLMRKNIIYFEGDVVPAITAYNAGVKGTMRLIKKAQSFDFLDYRKFGDCPEIQNYTINVLVAKKLLDNFDRYTNRIVEEETIQ
ncbi:MAG: lytic transglycosylase domain-containing protein [Nanoarchaeota archaeon]|nr:lytic transglycosylase domain-containing protein [Nanoarchaeota archaeon]